MGDGGDQMAADVGCCNRPSSWKGIVAPIPADRCRSASASGSPTATVGFPPISRMIMTSTCVRLGIGATQGWTEPLLRNRPSLGVSNTRPSCVIIVVDYLLTHDRRSGPEADVVSQKVSFQVNSGPNNLCTPLSLSRTFFQWRRRQDWRGAYAMTSPSPNLSHFQREISDRFGLLPNFFSSAPDAPEIIEKLWNFAKSAYVENSIPAVFKERLFVYLSRFCEARYCIARHCGFLLGYGHASGDSAASPQTIEQAISLLKRLPPWQRDDEAWLVALELVQLSRTGRRRERTLKINCSALPYSFSWKQAGQREPGGHCTTHWAARALNTCSACWRSFVRHITGR
jgi:hypothetical protein